MAGNKSGKLQYIQVMRVLACLAVMNGHIGRCNAVLGTWTSSFRSSTWSKSILAYLVEGDLQVKAFWVIAGFFISYNALQRLPDQVQLQKQFLKKIFYVLFPTFLIIGFSALVSFLCCKAGIPYFATWSRHELKMDVWKVFFDRGLPIYYSYQLWYIHSIFVGYIVCYAFWALLGRSRVTRWVGYGVCLGISWFYDYSIFSIMLGMVAGEICYYCKGIQSKTIIPKLIMGIIGTIAIGITPTLYTPSGWTREEILHLPIGFVIIVICFYFVMNGKEWKHHKILDYLDKNSFSVYLVHPFIQMTLGIWMFKKAYCIFEENSIVGNLFVCVILTCIVLIVADLFRKYVIEKSCDLFTKVINRVYMLEAK